MAANWGLWGGGWWWKDIRRSRNRLFRLLLVFFLFFFLSPCIARMKACLLSIYIHLFGGRGRVVGEEVGTRLSRLEKRQM